MNCLWNSLIGRKTYLVAISAFIALLWSWQTKKIDTNKFTEDTVALVIAATMRHGISTSGGPVTPEEDEQDAEELAGELPPDVKNDINMLTKFLLESKNNNPPVVPPKSVAKPSPKPAKKA